MAHLFVYATAKDETEATTIARHMVERKLAACANIIPAMKSFYQWEGEIQSGSESIVIFKTTSERYRDLEREIKSLHSYECPCIVALPIECGLQPYLDWISMNVD